MLNISMPNVSFSGMFKIIKKFNDIIIYESDWQQNLITDNGLDMLGRVSNSMSTLHLSAENTIPNINETQVLSLIRSAAGSAISLLYPYTVGQPYYNEATFKYSFPPTGAAYNCSKIHLSGGDPNDVFSSALIKDGDGDPTTLSVRSAETLEVIYAVRQYFDTSIKTSTMTLQVDRGNGVTDELYDIRTQVFGAGNASISNSGWRSIAPFGTTKFGYGTLLDGRLLSIETFYSPNPLPTLTEGIGNNTKTSGVTSENYVPKSLKLAGSLKLFRDEANYTTNGIRTVGVGSNRGWYVIEYTSQETGKGIPKTSFDELTLNFEISWGRYEGAL